MTDVIRERQRKVVAAQRARHERDARRQAKAERRLARRKAADKYQAQVDMQRRLDKLNSRKRGWRA